MTLCVSAAALGFVLSVAGADSRTELERTDNVACGPAALAIVFRLSGVRVRNHELAALVDETGQTTFEAMRLFAESKGLFVASAALSPADLRRVDSPAILQVQVEPGVYHFIVYAGISHDGERLIIIDPDPAAGIRGAVSIHHVVDRWTGKALVLSAEPLPFWIDPSAWLRRTASAVVWWVILPLCVFAGPFGLRRITQRLSHRTE